MSRLRIILLVLSLPLVAVQGFAVGSPAIGWVTVVGSQASDSGYVIVMAYGYRVEYDYSEVDTIDSVTAGLAASLNNPSSPVMASVAGNVLILTSKATGSAANSSSALVAIYGGSSFSTGAVGMIGGRDGARNFQMSNFSDGTDADIAFKFVPFGATDSIQPAGHSVFNMIVDNWWPDGFAQRWSNAVIAPNHIDLTRVDAVYADEPYAELISYLAKNGILPSNADLSGNPCNPNDYRYPYILQGYAKLQTAAAAIKQASPRTRFWLNFSKPETDWMRFGSCAFLNGPYVDVVSFDQYLVDFNNTVKPVYDYFLAHPGYPGQQLALIPGTFVYDYSQTGQFVDAVAQAHLLEEFFDYANNVNNSCTLPLGNNGVTQSFDGCPVWMITGWLYGTCCEGFIGLNDPAAGPIQAAWEAELSTPLVDHRRPAVQTFARTNNGNSFYYTDETGSVYQSWSSTSSSNAGTWHSPSITAIAGAPAATAGSALMAYTDPVSNNQDVYYVGADQHVHLLWWNGDPWKTLDLTAINGAPGAQPGFQFVRTNNGNSFYYLGTDGNIWQFWNNSSSSTTSWHTANINAIAGTPTAAGGSAPLGYTDPISNNQDIYYVGTDEHLHLLWWNGDPWKTIDITAVTAGPNVQAGTQFVRTNNGNSFYYLGTDANVYQSWNSGSSSSVGTWHSPCITCIAGAPVVAAGSSLLAYTDSVANNQVVYYIGADQHVHLLWWNGDPWKTIDLTSTVGGATASALAPMVVTYSNGFFYLGTDGNIWQLWTTGSTSDPSAWRASNISAIAGAPAAIPGSMMLGYIDPTNNGQAVYYIGTEQHIHLLWWMADPWRTIDITAVTSGPNVQ